MPYPPNAPILQQLRRQLNELERAARKEDHAWFLTHELPNLRKRVRHAIRNGDPERIDGVRKHLTAIHCVIQALPGDLTFRLSLPAEMD